LMVFLRTCWLVSSVGQCSRCSSSVMEFGIWHIVHSLDSHMPVFLKWAARQSCPILSLKFATTSFLGLPLYSAQNTKANQGILVDNIMFDIWHTLHFYDGVWVYALKDVCIIKFVVFLHLLDWLTDTG
jgi:hypothetical protein